MINVTFAFDDGVELSVETQAGDTLMTAAVGAGIPGILAECGGGAICGTCHVHVASEWTDRTGQPASYEEDTLDTVPHLMPQSRLACQIVLTEDMDGLKVAVPGVCANRKAG